MLKILQWLCSHDSPSHVAPRPTSHTLHIASISHKTQSAPSSSTQHSAGFCSGGAHIHLAAAQILINSCIWSSLRQLSHFMGQSRALLHPIVCVHPRSISLGSRISTPKRVSAHHILHVHKCMCCRLHSD
jgi:hypothetical protein